MNHCDYGHHSRPNPGTDPGGKEKGKGMKPSRNPVVIVMWVLVGWELPRVLFSPHAFDVNVFVFAVVIMALLHWKRFYTSGD